MNHSIPIQIIHQITPVNKPVTYKHKSGNNIQRPSWHNQLAYVLAEMSRRPRSPVRFHLPPPWGPPPRTDKDPSRPQGSFLGSWRASCAGFFFWNFFCRHLFRFYDANDIKRMPSCIQGRDGWIFIYWLVSEHSLEFTLTHFIPKSEMSGWLCVMM